MPNILLSQSNCQWSSPRMKFAFAAILSVLAIFQASAMPNPQASEPASICTLLSNRIPCPSGFHCCPLIVTSASTALGAVGTCRPVEIACPNGNN
ncbi:hypothetical protein HYPSUDRAFT_39522 [Hypholoma sublateritium FD-334 SS-4]|uniref:Hydrophobin n=1 Tax=Hypholoma sublateritium (strain FD-334 SS-4) TaxID=945553 RepID=A0A0D2PW45_HYPSF|nr:hypothetical protein HYPSUDRAFT_39522 [Hypholoma sublateritium FD-334 SS-4]